MSTLFYQYESENTMMKILEYAHTHDGIAYRVYDLHNNPDAYIDYGMFHTMNDVIDYCEKNDVSDYFDVTYRFVW